MSKVWLHPPRRIRCRFLVAILILQLILLFLVFPWLFIFFENEQTRQEIEEANGSDLSSKPRQDRSYINSLYWSLSTPITIGSDNAWPQTRNSRVLIRISDVIKLLTVGVIAGLLYHTMIIRKIQEFPRIRRFRYRRSEDEETTG